MRTTEFLSIASAIVPDRTAIYFDGKKYSFLELQQRANRLANAMANCGVSKGDRIVVMQVNSPQNIEAYFASAQLDAIYVPINFRTKTEELHQMLTLAQPSIILIGERYLELLPAEDKFGVGITPDRVVLLDGESKGTSPSYQKFLANASDDELLFPEADNHDTTVIMFTAGTTNIPKGVMLTHDSFASYLLATVTPADPDAEETNLLTVPLYHVAGLQAVLAAVYGGRTMVVMRQFETVEWMTLVQQQKVDRAMVVPTMLKQVMDHHLFHKFDLSSLKVITYGAAPMPLEIIKKAIEEFPGAQFINAFGQTETASTISILPPEDHILEGIPEEIEKKLRRLTSIGRPLEDVEVDIVDEHGHSLATGEVGEIVARGDRMMAGYWREEEATQDVMRSGWVYTGDLAYQDEDGYIYLAGRAKDFIKRGGEMVSPEEVEQVLRSHPLVEDAAVIGIPDLEWGEEVLAVIVARSEDVREEDLIGYCEQRLAGFKRPRSVVFIDELPRNVMGKVLKRNLRQQFGNPTDTLQQECTN